MPPGATTLLSVRTQCKQQSDNVGQSFIADPEWDSYIQASYYELYGLIVQAFGNDYFTQSPSSGFLITTDGINQEFALPTDFFKLLGVDLQISSPNYWVSLKQFAFADRNRLSISNNPTPMAGQVVRMLYVPRLILPTLDVDVIDGVNGWEDYLVVDACMKALAKEESDITPFVMRKAALVDRLNSEIENRDASGSGAIVDVLGKRARAMQYRLNGSNLWLTGNGMPGFGPFGDWGNDQDFLGWY